MASTSTLKANTTKQLSGLKNHVYTMVAAFAGVVFGVLGSMGFISGYIHAQFASETASLNHSIVSMIPTSDLTSTCSVPTSSTVAKPAVVTAAKPISSVPVVATASGSTGSKPGMGGGSFVSQMVNGTISDTGPDSHNSITTTNTNKTTVTNNNDFSYSSSNSQSANSGSATVAGNTTGGSATSGDATNTNSSSATFNVQN